MCFDFASDVETRGASDDMREKAGIDLMDFGAPDLDQMHVTNVRPLISLVKSNDHNFISQSAKSWSADCCLWTL